MHSRESLSSTENGDVRNNKPRIISQNREVPDNICAYLSVFDLIQNSDWFAGFKINKGCLNALINTLTDRKSSSYSDVIYELQEYAGKGVLNDPGVPEDPWKILCHIQTIVEQNSCHSDLSRLYPVWGCNCNQQ
jgi:hypothetical protein